MTAAANGHLKIWDIRTFQEMSDHYMVKSINNIDVSQTGIIAVAQAGRVTLWKDFFSSSSSSSRQTESPPYMQHLIPSSVVYDLHFRPFEDVLGILWFYPCT